MNNLVTPFDRDIAYVWDKEVNTWVQVLIKIYGSTYSGIKVRGAYYRNVIKKSSFVFVFPAKAGISLSYHSYQ